MLLTMEKIVSLTILIFIINFSTNAQDASNNLYITSDVGDKLSLHENRLGQANMYGFGVESSTLYAKSVSNYRWYIARNADNGLSPTMTLDPSTFSVKTNIYANGQLSLMHDASSLGDIISLYGDRLGNPNMYGFGIESNGGTLYAKAVIGYNWYINRNANQGAAAMMKLNSSELIVDGGIRAEEIKVEIVNGPDYVFEPDYQLRTLQETKKYIAENKHLPEIPSAKEMEANGVDLGIMNMRLLKKIEELTLHQIELLEKVEKLQKKVEELESK